MLKAIRQKMKSDRILKTDRLWLLHDGHQRVLFKFVVIRTMRRENKHKEEFEKQSEIYYELASTFSFVSKKDICKTQ